MASNAVLITGCSTGIGRATALRFAAAGIPTWASARRLADIADLQAAGCRTIELDVTNEASRVAAVSAIEAVHGAVGALVNNAGYGEMGPMEEVALDSLRRQFETNVFGLVRLTQLVLPGMRAQRQGAIVNLSSVGGLVTIQGSGPYGMSKFAVESFSDALRAEVRRFGIRVALIEPGTVRTSFGKTVTAAARPCEEGPYATFKENLFALISRASAGRGGSAPDVIAKMIFHAVTARRPKTRYKSFSTRMMLRTRRLVTDRQWDRLTGRIIRAE
jgi:NAD(P)-dependent dehydrogenase (short-subunit alcohol dehydrogenase family)